MVTSTASQQQQQPKKKFSVKKLLKKKKKQKYKEFQENNPNEGGTAPRDSGRSIEVLELDEQRLLDAEQTDQPCEDYGYDQVEPSLPDSEVAQQHRAKKTSVHFWRYSKDEPLLEHIDEEDCSEHISSSQSSQDTAGEDDTPPKKKKKSKKKKAKQVGLTVWKYCKRGYKYMKTGLTYYSSGVSSFSLANLGGFRPTTYTPTYTDYTQYDKYDQYGHKKRYQTRTDYTKYDAYCKTSSSSRW